MSSKWVNDIVKPRKMDFLKKYYLKIYQVKDTPNTNICIVFENLWQVLFKFSLTDFLRNDEKRNFLFKNEVMIFT